MFVFSKVTTFFYPIAIHPKASSRKIVIFQQQDRKTGHTTQIEK